MAHELAARPCVVKNVTNALGQALYKRARQLDQWEGENYDGSSVLGAVKAVQEKGHIKEYRWAFSIEELALAVSRHGPAILGISWYQGMSTPDAAGYIWPTGKLAGGHAILCNGFNVKTQAFRLHNSWGAGWGKNGACYIDKLTLGLLLKDNGEACIPVVRAK
jgi:C1A family cysteine protease